MFYVQVLKRCGFFYTQIDGSFLMIILIHSSNKRNSLVGICAIEGFHKCQILDNFFSKKLTISLSFLGIYNANLFDDVIERFWFVICGVLLLFLHLSEKK